MERETMVELTREKIGDITGASGINVVQAALLGLEIPLRKGHTHQLLWRWIPEELFRRLLLYKQIKHPSKVLKDMRRKGEID